MTAPRHEMHDPDTRKISISLPIRLKRRIEECAKADHRSISNFLQVTLAQIFAEKEASDVSDS